HRPPQRHRQWPRQQHRQQHRPYRAAAPAIRRAVAVALALASGAGMAQTPPSIDRLHPPGLTSSDGTPAVVAVRNAGTTIHIAGQTAITTDFELGSDAFEDQVGLALANLDHALDATGAKRTDLVFLRVFYVVDPRVDRSRIAAALDSYFGTKPRPAITWVGTPALVGEGMLVEVEGIAVAP
ncbi:RidA family protein, partial [Rhodothalassium salexigens]